MQENIASIAEFIDGIECRTTFWLSMRSSKRRGGEHSRGFAVVAGEVRALARRSSAASKEFMTLIRDSGGRVKAAFERVGEVGGKISKIVHEVARVWLFMGESSNPSHKQKMNPTSSTSQSARSSW